MVEYKDTGKYEQVENPADMSVYVGKEGQVDFSGKSTRVDDNFAVLAQNISNGEAYSGGSGIVVTNNSINVKYDNDTIKLNDSNKLYAHILYANLPDKLVAGANINIDGSTISVRGIDQLIDAYPVATTSAKGFMSASDKQKLDNYIAYELPTAATNILGGIKPDGTTIEVDASTGIASVIPQDIPVATTAEKGLMSATDKAKLNNIRETANYVYAGTLNGCISVNDNLNSIRVYQHPTYTPLNISPEADRILNGITVDSTGHVTSIHYTTASGITVEDETIGSVLTDIAADANTLSISRNNIGNLEIGAVDTVTDAITYPTATDSVKTSLRKLWNQSNTKLTYKGTIGTGGTVPSLPINPSVGDVYKALDTIDIDGSTAENGDLLIYDNNLGGWSIITSGIRPDSNTWRPISINGAQRFDGSITSGLLNIAQGANVTITYADGTVTINSTGSSGSSTYGPGTGIEFITVSDIDTINIKKATTSSLGGVKVGAGLNVDSNGSISVAYGNTSTTAAAGNHTHSEYAAASHTHTYDSITNKPTINDATITITQGGTTKGTFTLNQSSNKTIALDAGGGTGSYTFSNPLVNNNNVISLHYADYGDVGALAYDSTNGLYVPGTCFTASNGVVLSNYNFSADFGGNGTATTVSRSDHTHTYASITNKPQLKAVATSGSYNDLSDKPTIPTATWRPITVNSHALLSSSESDALTITGSGVTYDDATKSINITSSSSGTTYQAGNGININPGTTPNTISVKYDDSTIKRFTSGDNVGKLYVPTATANTPGVVQFGSDSSTAATGNHNHTVEGLANVDVQNPSTASSLVTLVYDTYDSNWHKANLATVASSGSYNDLSNKPNIPAAYSLPTANASTLGGVKIGNNVSINNGVISVATASSSTFGVVKIGDGITVSNGVISVTGGGGTGNCGTKVVTEDGYTSLQAVTDLSSTSYKPGYTRGTGAVDLQHNRNNSTHVASGDYSVAMGYDNTASANDSVAMGHSNAVSGSYSVAFGYTNVVSGNASSAIGESNVVGANDSAIIGGSFNITDLSADNSFIGGGFYNTASASLSAILGGAYNETAHAYSVSCGQHCYNPFPSTAINSLGNMTSLPSGVFGHSGKLSVTVNGGNSVKLMDFTKFMFSGILKLHYVIYLPNSVALVEKTIYIADNAMVYEVIDHSSGSPGRISGGILNRILYSDGWQNAIMYQVGVDYTCLCENNGGDGYYGYY